MDTNKVIIILHDGTQMFLLVIYMIFMVKIKRKSLG